MDSLDSKADIERQRARAPQVQQLEADIVQPAIAEQRAAEEQARGEAALISERGRADAQGLAVLIQAYAQAGSAGRDVFVLQKLLPLLGKISGAERPLPIARLSVLPSVQAPGAQLARQALGASEQLEAAAGVDLAELTRRLSERLGPG